MSKIPLPKVQTYRVKLMSLDKEVKFRPFTVKEQKILLMAKLEEDPTVIYDAISQVISLCTLGAIEPEKLPSFDFEKLFLHIRMRSVSENVKVKYKMKDTDEEIIVSIPLEDIDLVTHENHTDMIKFADNYIVKMSYPSMETLQESPANTSIERINMIKNLVQAIYQDEDVFYFRDFTEQEKDEWFDSLDTEMIGKLNEFFKTMPSLEYKKEVKPKTGEPFEIHLKGLKDFFM